MSEHLATLPLQRAQVIEVRVPAVARIHTGRQAGRVAMGIEQLVDKSGEPSGRPVITRRAAHGRQARPSLLLPKRLVRPIHTDTLSARRHRPPAASIQTLCGSTRALGCKATAEVGYDVAGP